MTCGCAVHQHGATASLVSRIMDDYDRGYLSRHDACSISFAAIASYRSAWDRAAQRRKAEAAEVEDLLRSMGAIK